ncbi:MAG: M50 family metallopeptidase [Gemmatimonadota bacterium]
MKAVARRRLRFLGGFAAYFGALWLLWETPLVYPLKIFVVLLHEISHGAAAIATGGSIERIVLTPDQGGACYCAGGNAFLTLSAGYLGSLGWGGLILLAGEAKAVVARAATGIVGTTVLTLTLLFVRNGFGLVFGLAFGATLTASVRYLPASAHSTLLTVLGLTSCLYAILDIKSDVLDRPYLPSDAYMLAELTGVPTLVWGTMWVALAAGASWLLFRRAFRRA